jgi:transcription elongation factor SPT5
VTFNVRPDTLPDEFIAEPEGDGDDEGARRPAHHVRLDRRERELNDQDLARIAEDVSQRYKRSAVRYTGDMNEVPQRLLMPSVQDANLWQVRCKVSSCFAELVLSH